MAFYFQGVAASHCFSVGFKFRYFTFALGDYTSEGNWRRMKL